MSPVRIVAFLLLGVLLFEVVGQLGDRVEPAWRQPGVDRYLSLMHEGNSAPAAVTLGNSRARAVDFNLLGVRGHHLWLGGMDLYETAALLPAVLDWAPGTRQIFVPIDPFLLLVDNGAGGLGRARLGSRTTTYQLLSPPPWRPIASDLDGWLFTRWIRVHRPDNWHGVVRKLTCGSDADGDCASSAPLPRVSEPAEPLSDGHVLSVVSRHARLIGHNRNLTTVQRALRALDEAVSAARRRSVQIVLYLPPLSKPYIDAMSKLTAGGGLEVGEIEAAFDLWLASAKGSDGCVVYLRDLWELHSDGTRPELFRDADHVNREGAGLFSERLGRALSSLPECAAPSPAPEAERAPLAREQLRMVSSGSGA